MMYLIMRCDALGDQYECDADRTPVCLVTDWKEWYYLAMPHYAFEVYEMTDNQEFNLVKSYEEPATQGMAVYFWPQDVECSKTEPTVISWFPNRTRQEKIPDKVMQMITEGHDYNDYLESCGSCTWLFEDNYYVYGEYRDFIYTTGY